MPTYFGIDVSTFQGAINWATVTANKDFAIIKSSGGDAGLYTDSRFVTNAAGARANGIKRGFYHFGSLGLNNAVTEANYFTAAIGAPQAGEIMVLDAESEASAGIVLSQSSVAWCKAFLDQVANTVGFKPFIYMSQFPSYSIDWSSVAGAGYPLWVASYGVAPIGTNLSVGAWSNLGRGYPIHQYSSSGSVPGISGNVDLDAFFVPAGGTLSNWDGYGKGGTTTTVGSTNIANTSVTPTTNNAGVAAESFYFQSDDQSLITPTESHDQVIYSVTTSDATLATGSHNSFYTIPSGVGQQAYPFGRFSYDGGSSWNDFGFIYPTVTTYNPVQPGVYIQPLVFSNGDIQFSGVNNTAGRVSLIIEIGLLASVNPSPIATPLKLITTTSYSTDAKPIPSATFQNFLLPPYSVYRRIALDSTVVGNSIDVAHGQSTIPNIMFWVQDNTASYTTINAMSWSSTGALGALGIRLDATNVHFHVDSATYANCFFRVYKDN